MNFAIMIGIVCIAKSQISIKVTIGSNYRCQLVNKDDLQSKSFIKNVLNDLKHFFCCKFTAPLMYIFKIKTVINRHNMNIIIISMFCCCTNILNIS